jgi:hypothetical protein
MASQEDCTILAARTIGLGTLADVRTATSLAVLLALSGCKQRETGMHSRTSVSATPVALAPSGSVARAVASTLDTPTAFELAPREDGVTLLFAPLEANQGALRKLEFDANGVARAEPTTLFTSEKVGGDVSDLSAAWVKSELALAWVERHGAKARVRAAWANGGGRVFELGAAWVAPVAARGNVTIAARDAAALVFARGEQAPCIEPGRQGCFGFAFHELEGDHVRATGLPLSVPVPCTDRSTTLSVFGSRWHYGVCTDSGERPLTTLFTIQRNPEYARADRLFEGCTPVDTLTWDGGAWLVAECQGSRRAVRIGEGDAAPVYLDLRNPRFECRASVARIRTSGFELELDQPRGKLGALLPRELAPEKARAVWTGRSLLVAEAAGAELRLRRLVCAGDRLESSEVRF